MSGSESKDKVFCMGFMCEGVPALLADYADGSADWTCLKCGDVSTVFPADAGTRFPSVQVRP